MGTENRKSVAQFIEQHGITMTCARIPARLDGVEWDKGAFHYLVTLQCGGRAMSFNYSMGAAHVEKIPYEKLGFMGHGFTRNDYNRLPTPGSRHASIAQAEWMKAVYRPKAPDIASVLDCVASDCAGYANSRCFEDWASEYGYDVDSRKAERTYEAVREQYRQAESLLGRAALNELMFDTERE